MDPRPHLLSIFAQLNSVVLFLKPHIGCSATMSDVRAAKLRKLNKLRMRVPHTSDSALAAILKDVAENGIPDLVSRNHIHEAAMQLLDIDTANGKLLIQLPLTTVAGGVELVYAVNPFAFQSHAYYNGGSFQTLLDDTVVREGHSYDNPLKLVIYGDEVTPGKELAHDNQRKIWCLYFSFGELLPVFHMEEAWFPLLILRTSIVARIAGGVSQVYAECIRLFFGGLPSNMCTGGCVLVDKAGKLLRLFAILWMVIQDGGAHKVLWHCKGDAGTRFCMICKDASVTVDSGEVDEDDVPILICPDIRSDNVNLASDADIRGTVDRLAARAGTMSNPRFELLQQAVGFRHEPHGILRNESLRDIVKPASQYVHDWMHCICVTGVMNIIIYRLLLALMATGMPDIYARLYAYCASFHWPAFRRHGSAVQGLFTHKRQVANTNAKNFKAAASEFLSLYPILALYVVRVVLRAGICIYECKSFLALCDLVDLLLVANLGKCTPKQLQDAVTAFLDACKEADWEQYMTPKFHWLIHLPYHLQYFGCLPTCWVHERKHRVAKRYAHYNLRSIEETIIANILSHNLFALEQPSTFDLSVGLVQPVEASDRVRDLVEVLFGFRLNPDDCHTAFKVRVIPAGYCCRGDYVLIKAADSINFVAGRVVLHVQVVDTCISIVNLWTPIAYDPNNGYADWQTDLNMDAQVFLHATF